jgi:hypothetical protein
MVAVPAAKQVDVERYLCVVGESLEKILGKVAFKVIYHTIGKGDGVFEIRPSRDIETDAAERFVHGNMARGEPGDTFTVAKRLMEGRAEADTDILGAVVKIDLRIPVAG